MADLQTDLLCNDGFPTPHPASIELRETHISWVFLTETEAFKVKKPVDFGFLDFTTIEKRRQACEDEVRLNARLAPNIYRGVVPVRFHAGRHHFGTTGRIVDWAVRMARLPDDDGADRILAAGALEANDIDALAGLIAEFHAKARSHDATSAYGSVDAILRNVDENFEQARTHVNEYVSLEESTTIESWQRHFICENGALFARRIATHRIREGHGDLRLEHVYLKRGSTLGHPTTGRDRIDDRQFTVIDCIEFADRFRCADVCADVAFLAMDLAAQGATDLGERFLATYARQANDFDLYPLVDFYESYRAYVRAKIAMFVANDANARSDLRERASHDARRHLLLSLAATRRSLMAPVLVAVGGVIASGKSTIADHLARAIGAPVVEADRTRKFMPGCRPEDHAAAAAWQGAYDPVFTDRVYEELLKRAGTVLGSGRPVIMDASFRSKGMRQAARDLARHHGVPFRFIECRATKDTCRTRIRTRDAGASDATVDVFDDFCARYEETTELLPDETLALDTDRPLASSLNTLSAALPMWPRFVA